MYLSINWLNDYVDTQAIPLHELVSGLTMSGSKVEKSKNLAEPLSKIVIGKVTQIKKHENSDKLWICTVNVGKDGKEDLRQIVTGAQNVTQDAIVPVVLDGGVVINRHDGTVTKIKKGKLRGEVSDGMLCSPDELGLEADIDGIMILPQSAEANVGGCMLEYLGLNDTVLEFEITNNRPDCFAVTGLAREVSATFDLPLNIPTPKFNGVVGDTDNELTVVIENGKLCSRYMAAIVKNVKVEPSPKWLANRLKAQGIRPINNIVDITNYVMLEYGSPLHAFDKRFIGGNGIVVRSAEHDEKIMLLDGNEVTLDTNTLVIADKEKPLAVAGVMGGEYSGIADDTTTVVFEAACFDKTSVRLAAKKIGRRTESSSRFEKGLSPLNTETALLRALQLVEELKAGEVYRNIIDCVNFDSTSFVKVKHDYNRINAILGADIPESEQIAIFKKLGMGYENGYVIVPSYRSDIELDCDLAEEVARIYGYNKIKSTLPRLSMNAANNSNERNTKKLADVLLSQGCYECITYSFVSPKMTYAENGGTVKIRNPFGEETSVMRTSMFPSMLKVIADNINAGNTKARLFETGRVYPKSAVDAGNEPDMLCIGLYGKDESFFTLKGIIEEICGAFKISADFTRNTNPPFHPGRSAVFDCCKGAFGEISPIVLNEYGISQRVYIAEINLTEMFAVRENAPPTIYSPLPKYPPSVRDLSLVCDDETASGDIVKIISGCKTGEAKLEQVEFFDIFKGGNLGDSQKSISYKLVFRKTAGTLTDKEVDEAVKSILSKLAENDIRLR